MSAKNYIQIRIITALLLTVLGAGCKPNSEPKDSSVIKVVATEEAVILADTIDLKPATVQVLANNVLDRMLQRKQLSEFSSQLSESALDSVLMTQKGPFTVFAISNSQYLTEVLQTYNSQNTAWPASFIVKGAYSTQDIYKSFSSVSPRTRFNTINENEIVIYERGDTLFFEQNQEGAKAFLYSSDLNASNGIVHILKMTK